MAFSFGAPAAAAPATSAPSFSFGAPAAAPAAGSSTGAFSFGAPQGQQQQGQQQGQQPQQGAAPAAGGFSFGASAQQQQQQPQQQQSTGFSFGAPAQQQPQQQQQGGGFSFGAKPAATAGSSLFGAPAQQQQQQQPQQQGFGQSGATQSSLFGGSLGLGQSQAQPFGQSQTQQPPQGQQQGQQQPQQQQQQQQLDKRLGPSLAPRIAAIHKAWNTQDLQSCRFLAYLYTSLPASLIAQFGPQGAGGAGPLSQYPNLGRRADAVGPRHEALWAQAVRENPDPERLVPALAVGFSDLKSRSEQQASEAARQLARLGELRTRLSALEQAHALRNSSRAAAAARRQVALHQRLVAHARRAHLLIPALRGASVGADEERLREKLERCEAELEAQGAGVGQGRLRARVNELWAVLGALKAKREMGKGREEWAVVDDAAIEDVAKILASQQQGLNHLSSTLEADTRALDTIVRGLQGVQLVGVKGEGAGDR